MPTLSFTTKAGTLEDLSGVMEFARILPILRIPAVEFQDIEKAARKTQAFFQKNQLLPGQSNRSLIVRSSAFCEDKPRHSMAGAFRSIPDVPVDDLSKITEALREAVESYNTPHERDEIFIQPMLDNISMAGVALTADPETLAPYYIISYDLSGKGNGVTSGEARAKTYIRFKKCPFECPDPYISKLIKVCENLEKIFDNPCIDVEFAFSGEELYIFQVRPLAANGHALLSQSSRAINAQARSLRGLYRRIESLSAPKPNLLGQRSIFGVMPDWNAAEIIGFRPKPLAMSLYKEIITDRIWAVQRRNYGYRDLTSHPLMLSFLGFPFIDVRVDFNSFIPAALNNKIAEKLANFYIEKLALNPHLHDKVEFEVVYSCYYPGISERLEELVSAGFDRQEIEHIKSALKELTQKIIDSPYGLYNRDLDRIEILQRRYEEAVRSSLPILDKISLLLRDCKRYGTLPFAGIARSAFVGIQFLKSFLDLGIMSYAEYESFLGSMNTVSKQMNADMRRLFQGEMDRDQFLSIYGHLRPDAYNILSPRYDENLEIYFPRRLPEPVPVISFSPTPDLISRVNDCLAGIGLQIDADSIFRFTKRAVEGREYSKFVFTRSLSMVLKLIVEMGERFNISREDLAFLNIGTILKLKNRFSGSDIGKILKDNIDKNKEYYSRAMRIKLPGLITDPSQVYHYFVPREEPNFITSKKVRAEIANEADIVERNIGDKIVFIKSAGPGHDFIFAKNIAGLVTQYGGVNSHMAIHCAEAGIPAVIGAGEYNFAIWSKAEALEIDCESRKVIILR